MASFDVFYFENNIDHTHPLAPGHILTKKAYEVLTQVATGIAADEIIRRCDEKLVQDLMQIGVLRWEGSSLRYDTPIFLRADAEALRGLFAAEARLLAEQLGAHKKELYALVRRIGNGFDEVVNLYHILCGMVLDGLFFDDLCVSGAVATSRLHPSGMDYLTIIYEKCEALDDLSRGLLCSWNRLIGDGFALQSFGDSDGVRHDFYRACQRVDEDIPPKAELLCEAQRLVETGECASWAMQTLEAFEYVRDGLICVPVFRKEDEHTVQEIAALVSRCLLQPVTKLLIHCDLDITAVNHGVNRRELANELYHILFGQINEELIRLGIVAAPPYVPGEGRYLKSIQSF